MTTKRTSTEANYFIPIYGSYYHFLTESALGLYNMLEENSILDSLDCQLWYQGYYSEIVQMFSRRTIVSLPIVKPYFLSAAEIGSNIKTLKHVRINKKNEFHRLIYLAQFLSERIPVVNKQRGITIIKRVQKRIYLEIEELADKLKVLQLPIKVVQMEKESFASQVNIMRNTQILIAPHGAGTMNQIFMPKGGIVIELFPMGYSNWHAKAVAEVFGHDFTEIESEKPGVFGREPSEEIRKRIIIDGWPDRRTVEESRKQSQDLLRVVRDVMSYSIDTDRIIKMVENAVGKKPH